MVDECVIDDMVDECVIDDMVDECVPRRGITDPRCPHRHRYTCLWWKRSFTIIKLCIKTLEYANARTNNIDYFFVQTR